MNTVVKWSNISRRSVLIAVMLFIILFLFWWSILPVPLFQDPYATVLFDREGQVMGMKVADEGRCVLKRFRICLPAMLFLFWFSKTGIF